ncbi:MAG: 4-(cytidine 5'-diphospho)-2-C-methyl-D-erythritol kinase [Eggerthellaceae bacterium]|nr:4-(cytidine 5'-diphospho)-2-C-methyl-D-erythritol kinase [Eggerthellaceae bacterium]
MQTVKLVAPAKVNLFLGIGPRRDDGYHSAISIMHALAMHDRLEMTLVSAGEQLVLFEPGDAAQPSRQLEVAPAQGCGLVVGANVQWAAGLEPAEIADEDNLACKAVHALAAAIGRSEDECIRIVIEKKIPHQTGLGGGSADAAAALVGAANLWGLLPEDERIEEVARSLGADVAFFIYGGCALLEGAGDVFEHTLEPMKQTLVIVKPDGGVSTKEAYAAFDTLSPSIPDDLLSTARAARRANEVPLFNNLAAASETLHDELSEVRSFLQHYPGVEGVLLCGSGAGTFAVCENYEVGQALSAAAQSRGWWARSTSFASLAASILP